MFNGKSGGNAAEECAGDLLGSFGCPEFDTIWDLFNILDLFDFGDWINDIQDAIQGFINIECSEERGIEFQGELDGILSDLPFDTDYNIDPIGIINDMTLPLEAKDNLVATQNGVGDSLKDIKNRFKL